MRARTIAVAATILLALVSLVYFAPILPFGSSDTSVASISREGLKAVLATVPQFAAALVLIAMTLAARVRGDAPSVLVGAVLAAIPGAQLGWLAVELVPEVLHEYGRANPDWTFFLATWGAAAAASIVVVVRAFTSPRTRGWLGWRRVLGVYGAGIGVQALLLLFAISVDAKSAGVGWIAFFASLALIAYAAMPRSD
jgi:hypothetical protein